MMTMDEALDQMPLVAILRGVKPSEAVEIGHTLYNRGFRCIEVPLNSPDPFTSIAAISEALPDDCLTGAGTVLTAANVGKVQDAGGTLIVTPNTNADVITETVKRGMIAVPGVSSATEAFIAVDNGATFLKLFPATTYGIDHLKALKSVLPPSIQFVATGGINASNIAAWKAAGTRGFGIGSDLYKAGDTPEVVDAKAQTLCAALQASEDSSGGAA